MLVSENKTSCSKRLNKLQFPGYFYFSLANSVIKFRQKSIEVKVQLDLQKIQTNPEVDWGMHPTVGWPPEERVQ